MTLYWVSDSVTSVDTDQILGAVRALESAALALGEAAAQTSNAALHGQVLQGRYAVSAALHRFVGAAGEAAGGAKMLEARIRELATWHAYAAWIFGAAEDDAMGMFASAGVLGVPARSRVGLLSGVAHIFSPLGAAAEAWALLSAGAGGVSAFTTESNLTGTEGFALQRQLNRLGNGLSAVSGGIPWLIFAVTGSSPLQQLAGSAARVAALPRRLGWQPSRLLVTAEPAPHPVLAGPGGAHGGKYLVVSADGSRSEAVVLPAFAAGSLLKRISLSLRSGVIESNLPAGTRLRAPAPVAVPLGIDTALNHMEREVDGGLVEILEHVSPGSNGEPQRSWSVLIRGTKEWTSGGANPQDMLTNLQEVGGMASDQTYAVQSAMELAGISPSEPVELIGHSQGGIVAANLVADPEFTGRFHVASVLTAGSPIALAPTSTTRSLHLENLSDPVPALDGKSNSSDKERLTVYFSPDLAPEGSSAHGLETYAHAAEGLETGEGNSEQVDRWLHKRREALRLSPKTKTISTQYRVRRIN